MTRSVTGMSLLVLMMLGAPPVRARPQVAAIAVHLLNATTGTLSADIAAAPEALGNVMAGPYAARAALVVVKVAYARSDPMPAGERIRLVAVEDSPPRARGGGKVGKRIILDRTTRLGAIGADGTTYAGFWLDGIGCTPLRLSAMLPRAPAIPPLRTGLGFRCYE